jgi:nuclear pore complex protein Nup62
VCTNSYSLAANLNVQLHELSKSLSQMIESVNALTLPNSPLATSSDSSAGGKKADEDPLQQIGAVLNAHLKSLQWIDETIRDVEGKVKEAERRMDGSAMGASVLGGRGGFGLGETMRTGTPGGELPTAFAGMALRQSEGPRQRGFGLSTTMRR